MRPIKLIISAFGPYSNETIIELDKLGDKGLYLITGDTGAGKTTIFDAITYALYGEASGNIRKTDMFRSKYANDITPTFVELTFFYGEKEYTIKRNPEYIRPSKRGDGTTVEKADATFISDGKTITRTKEVNDAVTELLGIDREQFTQIAMIAQGEFAKLITSTTDDRKKIFRKLFNTIYYEKLQNMLKNETSLISSKCTEQRNSIKQYINGIYYDNDLEQQLEKAKNNELTFEETHKLINLIIERDMLIYDETNNVLLTLDKNISSLTVELGKVEELEKTKHQLSLAKSNLENNNKLLFEKENILKNEMAKTEEKDTLSNSIKTLKNELPKYKNLNDKELSLSHKENQLIEYYNKEKLLDSEIRKLELHIQDTKTEAKALENINNNSIALEINKGEILTQNIQNINKIKEYFHILCELEKSLKIAQTDYLKLKKLSVECDNEYTEKYNAYIDGQAGIIASTLIENEKCPVCGSTQHPEPALQEENAPTKEELEKLKDIANIKREKRDLKSEAANKIKIDIEKMTDLIKNASSSFAINCSINEIETVMELKLKNFIEENTLLQSKINNIKLRLSRKEELLNKIIPKQEEDFKNKSNELANSKNKIIEISTEIKGQKEILKNLKNELSYENSVIAEKNLFSFELRLTALNKTFLTAQEEHKKIEEIVTTLKGTIISLSKQLENNNSTNLNHLREKLNELRHTKKLSEANLDTIKIRLANNNNMLSGINIKSKELEKAEHQYMLLNDLSNTALGQISGKEKIMLETYIQMKYFDKIIARANTRFLKMSNGQYELCRSKEALSMRSQSGLELDVVDHYNGSTRSVKTLSGGESFKASLSLALGLSDEIQSSAGGIRLDTMFVDEGFGSLDEESLTQAINALAELSSGNRLIGIISHVGELKEKIDKQIIVSKKKDGSSAKIIY